VAGHNSVGTDARTAQLKQVKAGGLALYTFFRQTLDKHGQTLFNIEVAEAPRGTSGGADLYTTVAYDKGKPAVRQGRKAVSLSKSAGSE
jgi:hypothetical protein